MITPELASFIDTETEFNTKTALLTAIMCGKHKVAKKLIETGVSHPGYPDGDGFTPLLHCVYDRNMALALIATGESNPGQANRHGNTALITACRLNIPEVALAIIETGESNPGKVYDGRYANGVETALIHACQNKMKTVVMALLATGESKPELVTNPDDRKFLQPFLDKYSMTAFIYTADKAKTGLTAENYSDIYDYLTEETQNAGQGTTHGTTHGLFEGKTMRNKNKRQLKKSRKNK